MAWIPRICLVFCLAALCFGQGEVDPVTLPQNESVALEYDYDAALLADLYSIHVQISTAPTFDDGTVLREFWWVFQNHPETPRNKRPIYGHVSTLEDGIYYLRCRVYNQKEISSDWSDVLVFQKDWDAPIEEKPPAPTGCRFGNT